VILINYLFYFSLSGLILLNGPYDRDNVTCRQHYKVFLVADKKTLGATPRMRFSLIGCKPALSNMFCANETLTYQWSVIRNCREVSGSGLIACRIFPKHFESYNEFAAWKTETLVLKIRGKDRKSLVSVETKSVVVTPFYRCPTINLIRPNNKMFI
jgi:hypothetical protein